MTAPTRTGLAGEASGPGRATADTIRRPLRIVAIDQDDALLRPLAERCARLGWRLAVHRGPVATGLLLAHRPDALLVEIAVLGPQWERWLARLSGTLPSLGLVVCTGPSTANQRVLGLRAGADDWITKPCDPLELVERLATVVRGHRRLSDADPELLVGELEVRPRRFEIAAAGRVTSLTRREYQMLLFMIRREGQILARENIYNELWLREMSEGDRTVDAFVHKLRAKLELVSPAWRYIHTHKGHGYRFEPTPTVERRGRPR